VFEVGCKLWQSNLVGHFYDEDQPHTKRNYANDPLEVSIGLIIRAREKKLKETLNELVQNMWRKIDLEGLGHLRSMKDTTFNSSNSGPRRAQFVWNKGLMCPAPYRPC